MILSVTNTTLPEPVVEWYKNGEKVIEDTKYAKRKDKGRYELIIASCEMNDDAEWQAIGTNKFGKCESSCRLTVLNPDKAEKPEFRHPLDNETVYEKTQLKLEVTVVSTLPVKVTWFKDGEKLSHTDEYRIMAVDNRQSLSILDCKRRHSGEYSVEAVNAIGKVSTSCKVTVKTGKPRGPDEEEALAPSIRMPLPSTRELPENAEVKLVCAVTGIPTPEISWYKDDREVTFAELSYDNGLAQLLIPKAKTTHSGVYTVHGK
uniref:Ig-like domain-containing protein n=1 Tax=Panagrolaimus sp. ES5 TaxID=591445 RepID=A0AC34GHE6_9BILA